MPVKRIRRTATLQNEVASFPAVVVGVSGRTDTGLDAASLTRQEGGRCEPQRAKTTVVPPPIDPVIA